MTISLAPGATIVFMGDSITDAGRDRADPGSLGAGYAARIAARWVEEQSSPVSFVNRGVGGDRVVDLAARWQVDCLDLQPSVVSIMVGINDTWRRYDSDDPTSPEAYEQTYRSILDALLPAPADLHPEPVHLHPEPVEGRAVVLIEPFLLPVRPEMWAWREDLDPRIAVVRRLAADFGAHLLAADGLLAQAAANLGGPELLAGDGVHLTPLGHSVLAEAWLELVAPA